MSGRSASAHDLAIDQLMLWPDPGGGVLRGELTFDPELTRSKDARPTPGHEQTVVDFLKTHLLFTLDGRAAPVDFEVRELWVRGGATLGDLVVFSLPLPEEARELRLSAGDAFKALVVSVQTVSVQTVSVQTVSVQTVGAAGEVDTTSWLLGRGDWTPVYLFGAGWQQPGWREGGPDAFGEPAGAGAPPPSDDSRAARPASIAARFVRLGFEHILPGGIDHMLFVAGLVLGSARRYRRVLISLTLFTLAHTLTLGLGNFQILQVPPHFVEPLIALSIFLLGVDNLRARRAIGGREAGRYALVFGFGLIHGLGFANALSELALERAHVVLALFSFNLGVELGQVAVVVLLGLVLYLIRERRSLERYATLAGSAVIALSGLFLVFERLAPMGVTPPPISQTENLSP